MASTKTQKCRTRHNTSTSKAIDSNKVFLINMMKGMSEEIQKAKAVMESLKLEYIYLHYADDCT